MSDAYEFLGYYADAENCLKTILQSLLKIKKDSTRMVFSALMHQRLSNIYLKTARFKKASEQANEAIKDYNAMLSLSSKNASKAFFSNLSNPLNAKTIAYETLFNVYCCSGNYEQAIGTVNESEKFWQAALSGYMKNSDLSFEQFKKTSFKLIPIYLETGKLGKAKELIDKGFEFDNQKSAAKRYIFLIELYLYKAELQIRTKNFNSAKKSVLLARSTADRFLGTESAYHSKIDFIESVIAFSQNDQKGALSHIQKALLTELSVRQKTFAALTDTEKRAFYATNRTYLDLLLTYSLNEPASSSILKSYSFWVNFKGALLYDQKNAHDFFLQARNNKDNPDYNDTSFDKPGHC